MARGCWTPTWGPTMTTAEPVTPDALVIEDVVAGYGGGDVLHGVSFAVGEGGLTCVVGPNGSGKSTLLAAISGLLRPGRGSITFLGEPLVGKIPRKILDLGIVHVPQNHSLFREMTVRENIELGGYTIPRSALPARRPAAPGEGVPPGVGRARHNAGNLSGVPHRTRGGRQTTNLSPA